MGFGPSRRCRFQRRCGLASVLGCELRSLWLERGHSRSILAL